MTGWFGVASREHVALAVAGGFCQLNHGREAPLRRIEPGDHILYYAPRDRMRAGEIVQAFVAIGTIEAGEPYQVEVTDSFRPYRRDVHYHRFREEPIQPLLDRLSFTRDRSSLGQAFRYGTFRIDAQDLRNIAEVMGVTPGEALQAVGSSAASPLLDSGGYEHSLFGYDYLVHCLRRR